MTSPKQRLDDLRQRRPLVDHVVRMVQHYGHVKGNLQAGAVTYFGFLSFFPVLALGFYIVGVVSVVYPDADDALSDALESLLPGIFGTGKGEISAETFQQEGSGIFLVVGLIGLLYAGLGWLSAMRQALMVMFEMPEREQPNLLLGKLRDLMSLAIIGSILVLSVAVTGIIGAFTKLVLNLVGLDATAEPLLLGMAWVLGFAANVLLFFTLFNLLAQPHTPNRSLWSGALLGAIGFEALKRLSFLLLGSTQNSPAFQVFGIALILVVWIYYFSRVVMYAASWAHTSVAARAKRDREALEADRTEYAMKELTHVELRETPHGTSSSRVDPKAAFAAGGASMLGLVALVRRRKDNS